VRCQEQFQSHYTKSHDGIDHGLAQIVQNGCINPYVWVGKRRTTTSVTMGNGRLHFGSHAFIYTVAATEASKTRILQVVTSGVNAKD
jgi:hypothetical protein